MKNDRPIENPRLQQALNAIQATMAKYGFAGACMLVSEDEAAFCYRMHAPWSAIRQDPALPLGFRIRSSVEEHGVAGRHSRLEGAAHTICSLSDFGSQTMDWMEQLLVSLRKTGLEIEHTPFNGRPLPSIVVGDNG
jgi:hypothetical protein